MLGLQGSGKTTTSAKLARLLEKQGRHPMLVSTDVRRPAAIQQLSVLAEQVGARVHDPGGRDGSGGARDGRARRRRSNLGFDTLIVDTAGRLHIDDELMSELEAIKRGGRSDGPAVRRRRDDRPGRGARAPASSTTASASPASC